MVLYLIIITIGILLSTTLGLTIGMPMSNGAITDGNVIFTVMVTFIALLAVDAIVAIIVHSLPRKWFNPFKKIFRVFNWERKFYIRLGIKHWKDRIPETGEALTGFGKDSVEQADNNEYIMYFMEETVYAEVLHFFSIVFSIFVAFIKVTSKNS